MDRSTVDKTRIAKELREGWYFVPIFVVLMVVSVALILIEELIDTALEHWGDP
jgi:competence protein ComGC